MRKLVVTMFVIVAAAVGYAHWAVAQKILGAAPTGGSYEAAQRCAQQVLWLPVGWLVGPLLLFVPRETFAWLLEPLPGRYKEGRVAGRALLVVRFAGLALILGTVLSMPTMPPECRGFYRLLLGW